MKFRAAMQDALYMREFQNIIATLSKVTKDCCIMKIGNDRIYFIANEESGTVQPLVWVDIDIKLYFHEYKLEPASDEHPFILLAISASNMGRALSMLRTNPLGCKMKLCHIQFPVLTIEVEFISSNSDQPRLITHDVPVELIPRCDWPAYEVPSAPAAQLVINIPSIKLMRGLIDKIKNISPNIIFYGTSAGELNLVAEAELATITTRYKKLILRTINPRESAAAQTQMVESSCSVDCRKAAIFFSALQLPTEELSIGIDDNRCLHLEIDVREGIIIHSILPAVCI